MLPRLACSLLLLAAASATAKSLTTVSDVTTAQDTCQGTSPANAPTVNITHQGDILFATSATFTFSGPNDGTFAYTLDGISQSKAITRQSFALPETVCR